VVPTEGALLWTDRMCVPKGATHLADAITFMDWVYEPRVAAQITQFVNYITPVPDARGELERMAAAAEDPVEAARLLEVAASELVFPTDIGKLHAYRGLSTAESQRWDGTFLSIYDAA
jgi:spermidine/putrescine transport system substrate-binding protein